MNSHNLKQGTTPVLIEIESADSSYYGVITVGESVDISDNQAATYSKVCPVHQCGGWQVAWIE